MRLLSLLGCLTMLGGAASPSTPSCDMAPDDRAWLERSLDIWQKAETDWLKLTSPELPTITAIDAACAYRLPQGSFDAMTAQPNVEGEAIVGEERLPVGPISFARDGGFVMSLPSVWRAAGVKSDLGLETLMEGVLLHEIMHTRQTALATAAFEGIEAALSDDFNDDYVQSLFKDDPAYVAAYSEERDALYAAAAASDDAEAKRLAAKALVLMQARRARWFTGERAWLHGIDDVFLTMEGMGQWLVYRHFAAIPGVDAARAMAEARRGGRYWTQDEGLALMLTVDRLLPGWQERAFREPDWRAEALLTAAIAG